MSGFNRLLDLFRKSTDLPLPDALIRHKGWGRVNQWMDVDASELAGTLAANGCTATLCEFLGFGEAHNWERLPWLKDQAKAFTGAMRHKGVWTHWTVCNWNQGEGLSQNGSVSICDARFSDEWFADLIGFFAGLTKDGGVSVLPCSELGVRNAKCRAKGLRWHEMTRQSIGSGNLRWNGNGDASPSGGSPGGELVEYHVGRVSDTGYRNGSLVVTDTSSVLNELGGLHGYVTNHAKLAQCVRQAQAKGCGFVHYGFDTPGIDFKAIETIGAA